jgi:hyaluronate lyase
VRDRFLSIALPHGPAQHASYSYLLMPGASAEATAAYCAQPSIVVEANSDGAAAASDRGLHVYAAALWQGGETVGIDGRPLLRTDVPAAVVLREQGGRVELSVSDPTQGAAGIVLDLLRPVASALTLDPAIEVLQTRPSLRLRVRVAGAAGRSVEGSFQLADDAVVFAPNPVK